MRSGSLSTIILLLILIAAVSYCGKRSKTEEKKISSVSVIKPSASDSAALSSSPKTISISLTKDESDFIIKMADARMTGILEGNAAAKKGNTEQIREYGTVMAKDQAFMLDDLKQIAKRLSVNLPDTITKDRQEGLKSLNMRESKKFDRRFVRIIKINLRRDAKLLANAKEFKNSDLRQFANKYSPVVDQQLEKVKLLRKKEKKTVKPI